MLKSSIARYDQLLSPEFQSWALAIKQVPKHAHRKVWEWCYICQALYERGKLKPGSKGLGFAVGTEPLSALFASMDCKILATDLPSELVVDDWIETGQHAASIEQLNLTNICSSDKLKQNVNFRPVDMRDIPLDLRGFDFCWSASSLEHLGGIADGVQFIYNSLNCLKPGGVAVHTTEYNVSSNTYTANNRDVCIYRYSDLCRIVRVLNGNGYRVEELCVQSGNTPEDLFVDTIPYKHQTHLKLNLGGFVCTSIGLIITKC